MSADNNINHNNIKPFYSSPDQGLAAAISFIQKNLKDNKVVETAKSSIDVKFVAKSMMAAESKDLKQVNKNADASSRITTECIARRLALIISSKTLEDHDHPKKVSDTAESYHYELKENTPPNNQSVWFCNGIENSRQDAEKAAKKVSACFNGLKLHGFYNPTIFINLEKEARNDTLAKAFAEAILQKSSDDTSITIVAHSHGVHLTRRALELTTLNHLKHKITVYAFGGADFIPKTDLKNSINFFYQSDLIAQLGTSLLSGKYKNFTDTLGAAFKSTEELKERQDLSKHSDFFKKHNIYVQKANNLKFPFKVVMLIYSHFFDAAYLPMLQKASNKMIVNLDSPYTVTDKNVSLLFNVYHK